MLKIKIKDNIKRKGEKGEKEKRRKGAREHGG